MRDLAEKQRLLPEYPSTPHLPYNPNTSRGDSVAPEGEAEIIFSAPHITVEEKVDGAFVGMTLHEGAPLLRNRNHILSKGYTARTEAKKQFAPLWNYAYAQAARIAALQAKLGSPVAVCGEWLVMTHTIRYDPYFTKKCPFVAFDVYDPELGAYLDPRRARALLEEVGFAVPELLAPHACSYEHLAELCRQPSQWSKVDLREGVYVKVGDGERLTHRFKMVRPGFEPGKYLARK